jgi:hypothetical protein
MPQGDQGCEQQAELQHPAQPEPRILDRLGAGVPGDPPMVESVEKSEVDLGVDEAAEGDGRTVQLIGRDPPLHGGARDDQNRTGARHPYP